MNKELIPCIALLATTFALPTTSSARPIRCDTCGDDASFKAQAAAAGEGTHLVYNVATGVVQQWYVGPSRGDNEPDPSGLPNTRHRAEPADVSTVAKKKPQPEASEDDRRAHASPAAGAGQATLPAGSPSLDPAAQH